MFSRYKKDTPAKAVKAAPKTAPVQEADAGSVMTEVE